MERFDVDRGGALAAYQTCLDAFEASDQAMHNCLQWQCTTIANGRIQTQDHFDGA